MPEYLAPGVFIEETSFRAKTIEGVSTSTAGFVGPTRFGPTEGEPELLTSLADFERIYGGLDQLEYNDGEPHHNYVAHAVRAFFEEGGRRLYVSRVYDGQGGFSSKNIQEIDSSLPQEITLEARFPGKAGDMRITFLPRLSDNLLAQDRTPGGRGPVVPRIREYDTVLIMRPNQQDRGGLYDVVRRGDTLHFKRPPGSYPSEDDELEISELVLGEKPDIVQLLTVSVSIERPIVRPKRPNERYAAAELLEDFAFHPKHRSSLTAYFAKDPPSRRLHLAVPFWIDKPKSVDTGVELAEAVLGAGVIRAVYTLAGGSDGGPPGANDYEGDSKGKIKSGLAAFEDLENISIVAAPGYSYGYNGQTAPKVETIQSLLINHCLKMNYRIAVLDSGNDFELSDVLEQRGKIDSTHAALYYPWVRIVDPITRDEIVLPPSGFVSGIYARNDANHGVHKAPANEVVQLAVGFEVMLNKAQQEVLNPEGVNCFRFFEGRGYRLWGARTISSDPEWKYVNLRRYFAYLERSVERGTQWVVFENNSEPLWANVRRTVEDFLFNEWASERLMGTKPEEAYFVRCDRSTMTQNDIDNGRLICLIGVAPIRPAEFVIFRIGQWTADRRS